MWACHPETIYKFNPISLNSSCWKINSGDAILFSNSLLAKTFILDKGNPVQFQSLPEISQFPGKYFYHQTVEYAGVHALSSSCWCYSAFYNICIYYLLVQEVEVQVFLPVCCNVTPFLPHSLGQWVFKCLIKSWTTSVGEIENNASQHIGYSD